MKCLYYFLCFLVLLWKPFYVNGCEDTFLDGDIIPLKKYVEALHDLRIYDTVTFITRKKESDFPDGISERPLRDYKELQGDLNILWEKVKALRSSGPREIEGAFDELHRDEEPVITEELVTLEVFPKDEGTEVYISEDSNGSNSSDNQQPKKNTGRRRIVKYSGVRVADDPQVQEEVSSLIENNKYITIAEIAMETGLAKTTIYYIIDTFKNRKGRRLVRRGSRNNKGYWIFFKEGEGVEQLSNEEIQRRRRENILFFIRENSQIKTAQLAGKIGVSPSTISNIIRELKDDDYLLRDGLHLKVLKGGEQYYDLQE